MKLLTKQTRRRTGHTFVLAMAAAASVTMGILLDANAANSETGLSHQQGDAILQELKAIRQLLERIEKQDSQRAVTRRGPAPEVTISASNRPTIGLLNAPVTVVEFTDFQCPFCRRFTNKTFPQLNKDYIKTGKVRWIQRDLPMAFHKDARKAAQAAHCAGDQGKYWEMREALFKNSNALGVDKLPGYAAGIGLEAAPFQACLESDRFLAQIDDDVRDANAVRITGTPSFVIGKLNHGKLTGRTVVGAQSMGVFESAIKQVMSTAGKQTGAN